MTIFNVHRRRNSVAKRSADGLSRFVAGRGGAAGRSGALENHITRHGDRDVTRRQVDIGVLRVGPSHVALVGIAGGSAEGAGPGLHRARTQRTGSRVVYGWGGSRFLALECAPAGRSPNTAAQGEFVAGYEHNRAWRRTQVPKCPRDVCDGGDTRARPDGSLIGLYRRLGKSANEVEKAIGTNDTADRVVAVSNGGRDGDTARRGAAEGRCLRLLRGNLGECGDLHLHPVDLDYGVNRVG